MINENEEMKKQVVLVESLRAGKDRVERDLHALELLYKIVLIKLDTTNQELSEFTSQIFELNQIIKQSEIETKQVNEMVSNLKKQLFEKGQKTKNKHGREEDSGKKMERQLKEMSMQQREHISIMNEQYETTQRANRALTKQYE